MTGPQQNHIIRLRAGIPGLTWGCEASRARICAPSSLIARSEGLDSYVPYQSFRDTAKRLPGLGGLVAFVSIFHAPIKRYGERKCPSRKALEVFFGERK